MTWPNSITYIVCYVSVLHTLCFTYFSAYMSKNIHLGGLHSYD